jgi:hypothetical protein
MDALTNNLHKDAWDSLQELFAEVVAKVKVWEETVEAQSYLLYGEDIDWNDPVEAESVLDAIESDIESQQEFFKKIGRAHV